MGNLHLRFDEGRGTGSVPSYSTSDERQSKRESLSGDQQIVASDGLTPLFETGAETGSGGDQPVKE